MMKRFSAKHPAMWVLIMIIGLLWCWLPFVEVAQLTQSLLLGRVIALLVYGLVSVLCIAVFYGVFCKLMQHYRKQEHVSPLFLVVVFFTWSVTELFVSWLVAVIWFGNGSSTDTVLPFASLTPFLMFTPFGLLARFIGYHGVSAAFVTLVLASVLPKTRRYSPVFIGVLGLLMTASWGLYHQATGQNITAQVISERLDAQVDPLQTTADLVVFPEYGLDDIEADRISRRLTSVGDKEVFFVGSQQKYQPAGTENVLIFGSTNQGFIGTTAKTRLIPGGEYLPYVAEIPLQIFRAQHVLYDFELSRKTIQGSEPIRPFLLRDGIVVGAEVCAGIIAPNDYRNLTKNGATALVNAASLEIFRNPVFDIQQEGLARFIAVANARPFLQSANSGAALIIDHNGRVLRRSQPVNTVFSSLPYNQRITLYTYLGEWPALIGGVLICLVLVKQLRTKRRPYSQSANSSVK